MSDRSWAKIEIGGNIPANLSARFLKRLHDAGLLYDDPDFNYERAYSFVTENLVDFPADPNPILVAEQQEVVGGVFVELETFLRHHDIPYTRYSAACVGAYDGEIAHFRPGEELDPDDDGNPDYTIRSATSDGESEVLNVSDVRHIMQTLPEVTAIGALAKLVKDIPPLPPFHIALADSRLVDREFCPRCGAEDKDLEGNHSSAWHHEWCPDYD